MTTIGPEMFGQKTIALLEQLLAKVDYLMSEQAEINQDVTELTAAVTRIQAEIAALQAANPTLDLSGLQAAVAAVAGIVPAPASTGTATTTPPAS